MGGALNIETSRVGNEGGRKKGSKPILPGKGKYGKGLHGGCLQISLDAGRWPSNFLSMFHVTDRLQRVIP